MLRELALALDADHATYKKPFYSPTILYLKHGAVVDLSVFLVAGAEDGAEALVERQLEVLAGVVVLGHGRAALVILGLK